LAAQGADLAALEQAAANGPDDSAEIPLALARARLAAGDVDGAHRDLDAVADRDPLDWRVDWFRGVAALVSGNAARARTAFDAVYSALPGELAPQLALAVAAERGGDATGAAQRYERVWRTDRSFVSAAFGQARVALGRGDRAVAVTILDAVPDGSAHHVTAQIAAARARFGARMPHLVASDLADASARVERLRLDVERGAGLAVELLGAALDWVRARGMPGSGAVLGHGLTERELRFGLERAYRSLAKVVPDADTRIALVDQANRVRPRTLV
ncbi:tetratricopeptide repeat protein, partial [Luedemannella flava]|uniref:tetratricopeptide repeat protein n=1 Tax=Luedemannella flava TaxID=349316 RepID=UPI0031D3CFB1